MMLILAVVLTISLIVNAAQSGETKRERRQVEQWHSLYETSGAGARELRHELTESRNATAKALGQGTRLAKRMHELQTELDAADEAIDRAYADIELARLAIEAQAKRTVPHNDGGSN